jgi:carboxymethylenebutenolidase
MAMGCLAGVAVAQGAAPRVNVHSEHVTYASGADSISGYIAYPEGADPAPAVLVIHDILGMSDVVRDATERLAQRGYVALAPDLLSRRGGTPANPDDARKLIASLNPDTITQDLDAALAYLRGLKAVDSSKHGVIGFDWGGGESFRYATNNPSLRAFVVCYGPGPNLSDLARIKASGFGVYADRDGRINQGLYNLLRIMRKDSVEFAFQTYPFTNHGFMRTMRTPPSQGKAKKNPAEDAWRDILAFLEARLK